MERTIPFDEIEGLRIKMENLISMRDSIELQRDLIEIFARGEYTGKNFVEGSVMRAPLFFFSIDNLLNKK